MAHPIYSDDLEKLPKWVKGKSAIGLGNIRFEHNQPPVSTVSSSGCDESITQVMQVVEGYCDMFTQDQ
jgi:hypothetical protein